jgi:uncharacterized protein GlcG (DUF336 family)
MAQGITLEQAQQVIAAATRKAADEDLRMNIAVVDAGNNLTAFARMDGAWLGSIDIALDKATTARSFDMPTRELEGMAQPGQPLYGIQSLTGSQGNIVVFAGGIPLTSGDTIIGAVGVSGGTPDQDEMVAQAGVDRL